MLIVDIALRKKRLRKVIGHFFFSLSEINIMVMRDEKSPSIWKEEMIFIYCRINAFTAMISWATNFK